MIRSVFVVAGMVLTCAVSVVHAAGHEGDARLDSALLRRAHAESVPGEAPKTSRVIIRTTDGGPATLLIASVGGVAGPYFRSLHGSP